MIFSDINYRKQACQKVRSRADLTNLVVLVYQRSTCLDLTFQIYQYFNATTLIKSCYSR